MRRSPAACVVLWLAAAGCGGRQQLLQPDDSTGATGVASIGPVDLTQAPPTLPMTCDSGVGTIAFDDPCLVGLDLSGAPASVGLHEVECTLASAGAGNPIAWAFVLPLAQIAANPDQPLTFPSAAPMTPSSGQVVDVAGRKARVFSVAGAVTFSRVDPPGRAFSARFVGTITWAVIGGSMFTCAVDAPLWGAPGSFL